MGKGARSVVGGTLVLALVVAAAWWLMDRRADEAGPATGSAAREAATPRLPDAREASALPAPPDAPAAAALALADVPAPAGVATDAPLAFTGRVVDEAGRTVVGATVWHWPGIALRVRMKIGAGFPEPLDRSRLERTTTDVSGRFTLPLVDEPPPPDALQYVSGLDGRGLSDEMLDVLVPALVVAHPGFEITSFPCRGWTGGPFAAGDLVLRLGARVVGRVVDEEHRPLAGISVAPPPFTLRDVGSRRLEWDVVSKLMGVETGDDGRFAFDSLWAGPNALTLSAPDRGQIMLKPTLVAGETTDLGDVVLARGGGIEGFVQDAQGRPLSGARVIARPDSVMPGDREELSAAREFSIRIGINGLVVDIETRTDEQGAFRIAGLSQSQLFDPSRGAQHFRVVAGADSYEPVLVRDVAPGGTPLMLTLQSAGSIVLTVVDATSDEPVREARVEGHRRTGTLEWDRLPMPVIADAAVLAEAGVAPDSGVFLLAPAGALRNEAIVSAPGHATRGFVLPGVVAPERRSVTIKLAREARVTGLVVDPADRPIAGATVTLTPPAALRVDLPVVHEKTDAAGRFEIGRLTGGDWTVSAQAPLFVTSAPQPLPLHRGEPVDDVRVVLQPGGAIEGVVLAGGQPSPGARVQVVTVAQAAAVRAAELAGGGKHAVKDRPPLDKHDALADKQGRFRFEGLSAEAWELTGPPGASVVAAVKAGETTEVTLIARSKPRVRGRVTDASGPVAGVEVSADMQFALVGGWLTGFEHVTSDANGQFDLEQEAPGHYRVGGRQAGTSTRSVDIDLDWDAAPWVELRFPGGIVRGRVVEADGGAPVAGATVALASAAKAALPLRLIGGKKRTTTTDAEGRFELQRVPGMEWAVFVVDDHHVEPPSVLVDVPDDAAAREFVVTLQRAGSLRGRVSALNGVALPKGLLVRAVGLDAQPDVGTFTPEQDGRFECLRLAPGRWRCELATGPEASALQTREATVLAGEVAEVEFAVTF